MDNSDWPASIIPFKEEIVNLFCQLYEFTDRMLHDQCAYCSIL